MRLAKCHDSAKHFDNLEFYSGHKISFLWWFVNFLIVLDHFFDSFRCSMIVGANFFSIVRRSVTIARCFLAIVRCFLAIVSNSPVIVTANGSGVPCYMTA